MLEQVHEIWSRVGRPPNVTYEQIKTHMLEHPEQPLTVYSHLTDDEIRRWRTEFEKWTALKRGSFRRQKIPGLDLGRPIYGRAIILETDLLARRRTSPAANTLELVYRISDRLDKPRAVRYQQIKDHIFARRPLPLIAWTHLTKDDLARWADRCSTLPGTDILCLPARTYPEKTHTAHLIGYTLQADTDKSPSQAGRVHYDLRGLKGRKGLEHIYNPLLTGTYGYQLLQIDAAGFHNHTLQTTQPKAGGDLKLTIDAEIQRMATEALANKQTGEYTGPVKGAAVVLDATNGDVLALVSSLHLIPIATWNPPSTDNNFSPMPMRVRFSELSLVNTHPAAHLNPLQPSVRSKKTSSFPKKNIPVQKAIEMRAVDRCDAGFTHKEAPTARLICKKHSCIHATSIFMRSHKRWAMPRFMKRLEPLA